MQTYLFYDLETTGLNKAFDQILHFAAIRTDLNFKEIDRYELRIKLNPDVTPSPGAMITHHMGLKEISEGISEYDAIRKIHAWINTPGTISIGYNTLSFDDEFLRFSFYRNLLAPYTHQYANQCARMDIYPMTVMYFLFKNEILNWPIKEGRVSLKLEELNKANRFVSGRSHHAMVDVEATLALAKILSQETEMWNYISNYFNKKLEEVSLQKLGSDDALMVFGKFGSEKKFQSIVLSLGVHYHYKNQLLWLRLDDKDFRQATKETILETAFVMQKKLGEPGFLLPLKERFMQHLSAERLELAKANKQWLSEHPDIFQFLCEHHRGFKYPALPDTDIDASLYLNGFWSASEEFFSKKFHAANPEEKSRLLESMSNPKLYALALRVLGRHFPEALNTKQAGEFSDYIRRTRSAMESDAIIDFKGQKRLTPTTALKEISEIRKERVLDDEQMRLLDELEASFKVTDDNELLSS